MLFKKLAAVLVICLIMALGFSGCAKNNDETGVIRVGSKDFTESLVVAEIYALALEDAGYKVERKHNIAGSIVHQAIVNNDIDLYPEYTGTGLLTVLKMDLVTDPDEVYAIVKREYLEKFDVVWLDQSRANDSNGLVIRTALADELGIRTISDLQAQAPKIRFASQGEFEEREDGLPGLAKLYGTFNFKDITLYDNGLKYEILRNDRADVAPAYTTEGQLVNTHLYTLLVDDQNFWPPYRLTPVVRNQTLTAYPEIAAVLNAISDRLDTDAVTALNAKIDVDKREFEEVAREFYQSIK